MNIKKIFLLSLILPGICAAGSSHFNSSYLHGFYAGASLATTSTTINNTLTFDPFEVEDANLYYRHQHASDTQVQPGFLVGYEHVTNNCWLLSGEFQANFLKTYINSSGSDYVNNVITVGNQYALQLRGGRSLTWNDNIIYGLIGVARTTANVNINFDNTNLTVGALGDLQADPINKTRNLTGLKLGVGYEKHINENLSLRIDYSHIQYRQFKNKILDSMFADIMDGPLGTSKINMSADMLTLSLIFMA